MLRATLALVWLTAATALGFLGTSPSGFTFMKIGVGARPVGMGGAYTAVADDANALFWNPAGLALDPGLCADVTMMKLLQSVSYASAGMVAPLGHGLAAGCAGGYLNTSDIRRDELGQEIGTFGLSDLAIGPGIAWQPLPGLGVGLGAKYVGSRIDSFQACAFSLDGGVIYRPVRYFTVGASLLHVGPPRKFIADWEYPPVNLRTGAAVNVPFAENHFILTSDLSVYPDFTPSLSVGAELYIRLHGNSGTGGASPGQGFAVRCGYQSGSQLGTWSGLSFGIGYEYELVENLSLGLDVVYLSYGLLGDSERASVGLRYSPGNGSRVKKR